MYESAKSSEKIMDKFKKCQRDNLVMPWSMEELYIAENDREAFIKVWRKNCIRCMTRQEYRGMIFGECEMLWLIKMAVIIFWQKNIAKI